jgi:hypothetical protein
MVGDGSLKVDKPIGYLSKLNKGGPIYDHPMDKILSQIQSRQPRPQSSIKLSHAFICLVFFILYLVVL